MIKTPNKSIMLGPAEGTGKMLAYPLGAKRDAVILALALGKMINIDAEHKERAAKKQRKGGLYIGDKVPGKWPKIYC